jgi:pyridoxamine 5'-phosphate oxidase family protein
VSAFTGAGIEYLRCQRLGRRATVNGKGKPHAVPVAFRYNAEPDTTDIGGHNTDRSKKCRDARGAGRTAFVVDNVLPSWRPRAVEIFEEGRQSVNANFGAKLIRFHPARIFSLGLDTDTYRPIGRSVEWTAG